MSIYVENLSKVYKNKPWRHGVKGLFGMGAKAFALSGINFSVKKGECVGIIGRNGSGKSTLLKILCGVTSATSGKLSVDGSVQALLELGAGFNPEYTGISNIYLNGAINGIGKKEMQKLIPQIESFADIGDYINKPVKTYSDGMFLRLAFACAVATNPDILVIDEALAVGDFAFRQKCFHKIEELKKSGVTIIMVSHDIDAIRRLCPRTLWLDKGEIKMDGNTALVSAAYMEFMTGNAPDGEFSEPPVSNIDSCINRFGSCVGAITAVSVPPIQETGKKYKIRCRLTLPDKANVDNMAFSVSFKNQFGLDLCIISSADLNIGFQGKKSVEIETEYTCLLCPGEYSLCLSLEDRGSTPIKYYDYAECAATFQVVSDREYFGVFHTPAEMRIIETD